MPPLCASTVFSIDQAVGLVFGLFVLPGVLAISFIANWLIRRWWLASLIGPLICVVVLVSLAIQERAEAKRVLSDAMFRQFAARRDSEFVHFATPLVLLSLLPSFGIGVAFSLVRRKRNNISSGA